MKINSTTILVFLLGSVFGAFIIFNLWGTKEIKSADSPQEPKIKRFNKNFTITSDSDLSEEEMEEQLEKQMQKMALQMQKAFGDSSDVFKALEKNLQDSAFDAVGANVGEIVTKVTKDSVILEMDVSNIDNSSLNIEVKDGQVSISGEARIEQKNESGGSSSSSILVSSFNRSYPVPRGTRGSGLKIENKGTDKLQLIFPKIKK
jgi:HSP20 family molecular chaperone IbpA